MKNLYDFSDWSEIEIHQKIGEILMQSGKITLEDLGVALDIQKIEKIHIGEVFVNMKAISREELEAVIKLQKHIDEEISKKDL